LALRARALALTESKQNRPPLDEPPIAQPRQGVNPVANPRNIWAKYKPAKILMVRII